MDVLEVQSHVCKAETHLPTFHPFQEQKKLKENWNNQQIHKIPKRYWVLYLKTKRSGSEYDCENKEVLQIDKQLLVVNPHQTHQPFPNEINPNTLKSPCS